MTNKDSDGRDVPKWYRLQDYERIESYIKQETESFIEVLNKLVTISDIAIIDNEGNTPCNYCNVEIIKLLVKYVAKIQ